MKKTEKDKITGIEGGEVCKEEKSPGSSTKKNPKKAGKRKGNKIEIEITNDETENVTVMSKEKQSKVSEDKTKETKGKKQVSETRIMEKAAGSKGGKSGKKNKKTLHVKFHIQPKHASK